ncbi:TIGR03086 family metal-binding protein [Streptomyces laculatispora]|uniref:TIGR03086 family metal-binding protein n=1 Tax=Streptomyces laculatispora TaxID=887464 RepID=UPI001A945375|nr:TIGR03086 family metal-binding protein [Streptomyces laculatispora]MBO0917031.1 TIGR03086 family protein [Streptomyces laculatispora]
MKKISELLDAAAEGALPVVRGIDDSRLSDPTPCAQYDVRALVSHLTQVVVNFTALAARQEVEFGETPDAVTGDWRKRFGEQTAALVDAWARPGAEDGTAGSLGFPARTVGHMALSDLTVHVWDLARATGQEFVPDADVVSELATAMVAMAPKAREAKVFGEPFPVPEGASPFARVLALTGRDPDWQRPRG